MRPNDGQFVYGGALRISTAGPPKICAITQNADAITSLPSIVGTHTFKWNNWVNNWGAGHHNYKGHETTTLFAALNVVTGKVHGKHSKRRRRKEFLAFMNDIVAAYADEEIRVILCNLNTQRPHSSLGYLTPVEYARQDDYRADELST